jgi:hypothetical protein
MQEVAQTLPLWYAHAYMSACRVLELAFFLKPLLPQASATQVLQRYEPDEGCFGGSCLSVSEN